MQLKRTAPEAVDVVLFCGGRGNATIARELVRWPRLRLTLLVNAYDDGLSTGALRALIPDMLGPSDFRKNLSALLELHSSGQYALQNLLEYRLPPTTDAVDIDTLERFARGRSGGEALAPPQGQLFAGVDAPTRGKLLDYLASFFDYYRDPATPRGNFSFTDCSLGNLIFAGAYLRCHDFNESIRQMAELLGTPVQLVNVTRGESRTLVGLKEDGQILRCEAEVVGQQSAVPIHGLFLLERALSEQNLADLEALELVGRYRYLKDLERPVELSPRAAEVIGRAKVIIYGPGTQFSSLMPSYMTRGLAQAIWSSPAQVRVFVANLEVDHDIQRETAWGLVGQVLERLGDPDNQQATVTHMLYNRASATRPTGLPLGSPRPGVELVEGEFENPVRPQVHSGYAVISQVLKLLERRAQDLTIYVDLVGRSLAKEALVQEFAELPWHSHFSRVRLLVNQVHLDPLTRASMPAHLSLATSHFPGNHASDVEALKHWLEDTEGSEYLLTLTGDGEYRLRDVFLAREVFGASGFGAVYGSRTQSRRQFRSSLRAAYGEGSLLYLLSWLGGYLFSSALGAMQQVILSDPLTGFRLYRRSELPPAVRLSILEARLRTSSQVTRLLLRQGIEIAEIPVQYRTFKGFTRAHWRLRRGLRDLFGMFRK